MGYPKDLDEYDDDAIRTEWRRRRECARAGVCHYCGRSLGNKRPCKLNAHDGVHKRDPLESAESVREYLGRQIVDDLPEGWVYLLVLTTTGENGLMTYTSNIARDSAVEVIRELADKLAGGEKGV